ncbi:MAG: hypothetical protein AMXMBFR53_39450 [Gemmatimonadota bacterium]
MDLSASLRSGARVLRRRPGYSLLVVATLALGTGGTTAVFSLVNGVLLESIPYADPDRLVTLEPQDARTGFFHSISVPDYEDWRDRSRAFDAFAASAGWNFVRETREGAEMVSARAVLGDFFGMLGMDAAHGRLFVGEETGRGAEAVVVLGAGFFQRVFGGDPATLGSSLVLDGRSYTVVGVLPPGVGYPSAEPDVYFPMGALAEELPWDVRSSSFGTRAIAHLAEGVTLARAQEDMNRVTAEVDEVVGEPHVRARVTTLEEMFLGDVDQALWLLLGAVALVLLIGGANVANLSLARGEGRWGEMAVRRALGADRGEVVHLLLAESLVLSALGGGAGLALAWGVVGALPTLLPFEIPALVADQVRIHPPVLAFAAALCAGCAVLFGLLPALRSLRGAGGLGQGTRATGDRAGRRLRDGLVVAQVALSVLLLVGSGLLMESLSALARVDKGFDEEGVLTARLRAPDGSFDGRDDWLAFNDGVMAELEASPDVARAAMALLVPLSGRSWEQRIWPEGTERTRDNASSVLFNIVSEGYFDVMGTRIVRGRGFEAADQDGTVSVAVIDETMAEQFWPGEDPLGKRVSLILDGEGDPDWRTVVGVAANVRHYELQTPSRIQVYLPMRQAGRYAGIGLYAMAKVRGDVAATSRLLRGSVAERKPGIPVSDVRTLETLVDEGLGTNRALGAVTAAFGVAAALLACLGIFGVLTLAVSRQAREIGIRMAVGAAPGAVWRGVVARGMGLAALGAALGLAGAAAGGRVLASVLYQVTPWDAAVYAGATALLLAAALVAVAPPAARAAGTAPSRVLRQE